MANVDEAPRGVVRCNANGETGAAVCAGGVHEGAPQKRAGEASAGLAIVYKQPPDALRQVMRSWEIG